MLRLDSPPGEVAIEGQGAPVGAPMVETYQTDPTVLPPAELVTRVAVATAPAGAGGPA
jgi:hypothetical protein